MTDRSIVAQFIIDSGGRFSLWSLTVLEEVQPTFGKSYMDRREYDVETSKEYGYIFHHCGSGGGRRVLVDSPYLVTGNSLAIRKRPCLLMQWPSEPTGRRTRAIRKRNKPRQLSTPPKGFDLRPDEDFLDWLQRTSIESDAVYCSECRDFFPEDNTCEHVWWCDKAGWWSTPSEPCGHERGDCEC